MKASQAFGILSVLAIAGAACCLGLVMMTKKGILLFGAIAGTFMSCKHIRYIYIVMIQCVVQNIAFKLHSLLVHNYLVLLQFIFFYFIIAPRRLRGSEFITVLFMLFQCCSL